MLLKIVSFISSIIMLFVSAVDLPEKADVLVESLTVLSEIRTADEINGANGVKFYIQRPKSEMLNKVNASSFGLSEENEDNYAAFQSALDYCAENSGTKLVIDKGTYYFTSSEMLVLNGASDIYIEGSGATFVFSSEGYKISIQNCDCVEINNLNCDWNWDSDPLASVVTIANSDPDNNTLDLVFENAVGEDIALMAITQCDSETYTFGAKQSGKEIYLYQDENAVQLVEKIADNTLRVTHSGCMDNFYNDETYILRHHVYGGTVFQITSNSENITFDSVNIYSFSGMAFIAEGNCSHFQIINSTVGSDERCVSVTADAVHIVNTNGCFNISNCDMSRMGDDAVNVHDGLGYVTALDGNTLTLTASAMRLFAGDTLAFKNEKFEEMSFSAKIVSVENVEGITQKVVLEKDVSKELSVGSIAYNTACDSGNYVIRDNYFHENRARGLLLQSSNGLCENNEFYRTMGQAIKVIMDIQHTLWQEGTGVDNLIITGNTFTECNYSDWQTVIEIGSNIAGKSAETAVFTNIVIDSNIFADAPSRILTANNVNGLVFSNNSIEIGECFEESKTQGTMHFDKYCSNITYENNSWSDSGFLKNKEIARSKNVSVWAQINSQL